MKSVLLISALTLAAFAQQPQQPIIVKPEVPISGPFGLRPGMSKEALTTLTSLKKIREGVYALASVPNPHPDFTEYWVVMCPVGGLVKVIAESSTITTNVFGVSLKEQFDNTAAALTAKYGAENLRVDFLREGSLWTEPQDWTMGLLKEDRKLEAFWNENPPRDRMTAIELQATAASQETGHLRLSYEFVGFKKCADTLKLKTDAAF